MNRFPREHWKKSVSIGIGRGVDLAIMEHRSNSAGFPDELVVLFDNPNGEPESLPLGYATKNQITRLQETLERLKTFAE